MKNLHVLFLVIATVVFSSCSSTQLLKSSSHTKSNATSISAKERAKLAQFKELGCKSCSKSDSQQKQELAKQEKKLVDSISQKLQLTDKQKISFEAERQVIKIEDSIEDMNNVILVLEDSMKRLGSNKVGEVEYGLFELNQLGAALILGFDIQNHQVAKDVTKLLVSLVKNFKEQIELREKTKK
jgi:hypothetical protein